MLHSFCLFHKKRNGTANGMRNVYCIGGGFSRRSTMPDTTKNRSLPRGETNRTVKTCGKEVLPDVPVRAPWLRLPPPLIRRLLSPSIVHHGFIVHFWKISFSHTSGIGGPVAKGSKEKRPDPNQFRWLFGMRKARTWTSFRMAKSGDDTFPFGGHLLKIHPLITVKQATSDLSCWKALLN